MNRVLLLSAIMTLSVLTFAQTKTNVPKYVRNISVERVAPTTETMNLSHDVLPSTSPQEVSEEAIIGTTYYDLQTNTSMQNRLYVYPDGTAAGVFTFGMDHPNFANDRGTGYNYYDGTDWGPYPTEKIEDTRCGWPAYAPLGENGEIVVTHSGNIDIGLLFNKRAEKGTGDWTQFTFQGPDGHDLLWPRMTTGGVDHSVIHLLAITTPEGNGGTPYEGLDGAVLYSRSSDGGATWDIENLLFDELSSDIYSSWDGDTYEIQAKGDVVAFLIGDSWRDLVLMKSTDGGETFEKTTIWDNLYKDWSTGTVTDTFYCADGAKSLTFDNNDMVHVAFGINRALSIDGTAQSWFPGVDGLGYWNENRPTFSDNKHSLDPYNHPDSELEDNYSLIGWTQDYNGNGEIEILWDNIALYYIGISSQPQIHVDEQNKVFIGYSSVTETFDDGVQTFRHLWMRTSPDLGTTWGDFHHLTSDLIHIFDENVFPSIASYSDDAVYLTWQTDDQPGLAVRGDEDPYGENSIRFMKIYKADVVGVKETKNILSQTDVSQNFPNPFNENSTIIVNLNEKADLSLEVINITGQKVYELKTRNGSIGANVLTIDGSNLTSGVYFYTVKAGDSSVTKKMIIE